MLAIRSKGNFSNKIGLKQTTRWKILFLVVCYIGFVQTKAQQNVPKSSNKTTLVKTKKDTNNVLKKKAVSLKKDSSLLKVIAKKKIVPNKIDTSLHKQKTIVHHLGSSQKKDSSGIHKSHITVSHAINKDSTHLKAAALNNSSKTNAKEKTHVTKRKDPLWEKALAVPYLSLKEKPIYVMDEPHPHNSKDSLFFSVCGVFLLFGIARTSFPKYTDSLFKNLISFSSIDKSDYSIGQNNLPSLLLNILFCLALGLTAALMIVRVKEVSYPIWQIWLVGSLVLGAIYLVKFLTIQASGWIFNATADAHAYMYVVFLINKVIGVLSLPAILIFAFADSPVLNQYIITIGSILIVVLLLYRYIITFSVITRNLQLNAFHFFLYLCSVEVIPILILYKLFFKDLINLI